MYRSVRVDLDTGTYHVCNTHYVYDAIAIGAELEGIIYIILGSGTHELGWATGEAVS